MYRIITPSNFKSFIVVIPVKVLTCSWLTIINILYLFCYCPQLFFIITGNMLAKTFVDINWTSCNTKLLAVQNEILIAFRNGDKNKVLPAVKLNLN